MTYLDQHVPTTQESQFGRICANTMISGLRQDTAHNPLTNQSFILNHHVYFPYSTPLQRNIVRKCASKSSVNICIKSSRFLCFFSLKQKLAAYQHVSPVYSSWKEPGNPTVPTTTVVFQSFPSVFTYIISFSYYPCLTANDSWLTNCWLED